MDTRVTRLETHMEYVHRDLSDLKVGVASISDKLDDLAKHVAVLPTRRDLESEHRSTRLTVGAIFVGSVLAGLAAILATQANLLAAFQAALAFAAAGPHH